MANYPSYAMLATIDIPVRIRLPTTIIIACSHHQQIVHIQFNSQNKSILGRAYTNLFQNPLTRTMNPRSPSYKYTQPPKASQVADQTN